MAIFIISYRRPGEGVEAHEVGAKSEIEARIRFLNLGWVVFTGIEIVGAEPKEPVDVPAARRERSVPPAGVDRETRVAIEGAIAGAAKAVSHVFDDWRAMCDALTEKIGRLADEAQACDRAGRHRIAKAKRAKAKELAVERAAITKRNRPR